MIKHSIFESKTIFEATTYYLLRAYFIGEFECLIHHERETSLRSSTDSVIMFERDTFYD
jgi:hypothetical protein